MVRWQHRPVALAPTAGGPDSAGVFTGSMVLDNGRPVAIYTGVVKVPHEQATIHDAANNLRESQCLAMPNDDSLDTWTKLPEPVIAAPPPGMQVQGFRDPAPWREKDAWYMVVASGQKGIGGNVLLYRSHDLRRWEYLKIFAEGAPVPDSTETDAVNRGEMWECPDFFPLRDSDGSEKHVLIHSTGTPEGRATVWQSGVLNRATMTFTPQKQGVLNHGPFYAPKTQLDAEANRILWGWIPETRPEAEFAKAGWAGCMSLPRALTLERGELRHAPAKQVRGFIPETSRAYDGMGFTRPDLVEYDFRLRLSEVRRWSSMDDPGTWRTPALVIRCDRKATEVVWSVPGQPSVRISLQQRNAVVRCLVDRSVVEVFLGDECVLTGRSYNQGKPCLLEVPGA
jgi:beta-fructofuranosidase